MKANRKRKKQNNDRAEIGIGTMIVFIAAVIVAAIAAAVLINTAGNLERQASDTGSETTDQVSSNMFVRDIVGHNTTGNGDSLEEVYWYISLAPGANTIDLNETILRIQYGDSNEELLSTTSSGVGCDHADYTDLASGFCVDYLEDSSDTHRYVLSPGDLVKIGAIFDEAQNEEIDTRTEVDVKFLPEDGTPVVAGFTTPSSLGGSQYVSLK